MTIHEKLTIKKVINADGKMSILGVSTISDQVAYAIKEAGQSLFVMTDFERKIDKKIAQWYQAIDARVVNSASAGIALSIASLVYGNDVDQVHKTKKTKNQIILPKGQNINYGAPVESMIYLGGGELKEAGFANECSAEQVKKLIDENTVGLMYVVSHHCVQKNILSLAEMIQIAQSKKIPLIVDCAAEEDLEKYIKMGIDYLIFSGAKAIEGPTSGLVFANHQRIETLIKHQKTIGRAMKIGKESIYGLYIALENYQNKNKNLQEQIELIEKNCEVLNQSNYLNCEIVKDNTREIYRIKLNLKNTPLTCETLSQELKNNDPAIYLRDYQAKQGSLEIDFRSLKNGEIETIKKAIEKIIERK